MKKLIIILSVLFLSGCSLNAPTPEELFAGAYGDNPKSATYYHDMVMEATQEDGTENMSMQAMLVLQDVFDSKAHASCVFGVSDTSTEMDIYTVNENGNTVTYYKNIVGNYERLSERDGFSVMQPELDISRYNNLKVKSQGGKWVLTGQTLLSDLSGIADLNEDIPMDITFTFDKKTGYIEKLYFELNDTFEMDICTVTKITLDIRVSNINTTDFELPDFNGGGN